MEIKTTLKPEVLAKYLNATFIETGTYDGSGCLVAVQAGFRRVISLEIDPGMFKIASERLKDLPQVDLVLGDSMLMLPKLLEFIDGPCTFWLDAHSPMWGVSPVEYELAAIAKHHSKTHTVLIDDLDLILGGVFGDIREADLVACIRRINADYRIVY
jgi:hypothetical protein